MEVSKKISNYLPLVCVLSRQDRVGNLGPAMGTRNQVGIVLLYRPACLCSLATQFQTRFLESIPHPMAGLKFPTLEAGPTNRGIIPARQATSAGGIHS